MFGRRFTLFRLMGFAVRVDASWALLAVLVVWTLARGFFPLSSPGLSVGTYWWMGILGALGLFASIVLHEFAHAYVARRYGIPMKGITLFIFGGVAEMDREPPNPTAELRMAIAGPLTSVAIGVFSYILYAASAAYSPTAWASVLWYLAFINILLAVFNMLPAFPLDGGRVLRAFLWGRRNDLRSATRTASKWGSGFGAGLIVLGLLSVLSGNFIGGLWWFLIGMFLRSASQVSYKQVELREALAGEPVSRFVQPAEAVVPPNASLQDLMDFYFYRYYRNVYPVVEADRLVGCVDVRKLKEVPRETWNDRRVTEIAESCGEGNVIRSNADAMDALTRMTRSGRSWLMVADQGRLAGIVSLRDLMNYVVVKLDLDGPDAAAAREAVEPAEMPGRR